MIWIPVQVFVHSRKNAPDHLFIHPHPHPEFGLRVASYCIFLSKSCLCFEAHGITTTPTRQQCDLYGCIHIERNVLYTGMRVLISFVICPIPHVKHMFPTCLLPSPPVVYGPITVLPTAPNPRIIPIAIHGQELSMSGPDATKIGTSMNIAMAAIVNCNTEVTALCMPPDFFGQRATGFGHIHAHGPSHGQAQVHFRP